MVVSQYKYWEQQTDMINLELDSKIIVSKTFEYMEDLEDMEEVCEIADFT